MSIKSIQAVAATVLALLAGHATAQGYVATKLVSPGSEQADFLAFNDTAQLTGADKRWLTLPQVFITGANGIGVTLLRPYVWGDMSVGTAINNSGQVVGYSAVQFTPGGELWARAFVTGPNGAGMTQLGTLGGLYSWALGINNVGQVVGYSTTNLRENEHAFITGPSGVGMTDIGASYAFSVATAINDSARVVGYFEKPGFAQPRAFITGPNGAALTDLGSLGGEASYAFDINESSRVVGIAATADGFAEAFITGVDGLAMASLGTLGGRYSGARSLNDLGQVVGFAFTAIDEQHAFVTGIGGADMLDLNALVSITPGHYLQDALGINNVGQILATGSDGHTYLLTPVPEPSRMLLLLAGVVAVGLVARQRKLARHQIRCAMRP